MRTGALILGIIGGLIALAYGLLGFGIGSLADTGEAGSGQILKLFSIGLPVAALVGAGIVKAKPEVGAVLMAVSAAGFVLVLGFNFFTIIPVVVLGLAAFLGLMSMQAGVK